MRRPKNNKHSAHPKRAGRPPRLSRELIVKAGVEFLRNNRDTPLTMARVARAAGATPMAIYRHLQDRSELLAAVAERILGELEQDIPADADWREQVRAWMTSMHGHLMQFPQCLALLGTETGWSLAWLRSTATLVEILGRTGLTDQALVAALFWVEDVTIGHVRNAISQPLRVRVAALKGGLRRYKDDRLIPLQPLTPHIEPVLKRAFDSIVKGTIAGIEDLLSDAKPRRG